MNDQELENFGHETKQVKNTFISIISRYADHRQK